MGRIFLVLAVLLLSGGAALGDETAIERRIAEQDTLMDRDQRVRLLNEAKAAVSREDDAANRYLLGRAYGLLGELEKAREQFAWALERNPAYSYGYYGLGVYLILKGNHQEARRNLESALKMDPRLKRARVELAKLHLSQGEQDLAEREFLRVLKQDPADTEVRTVLGRIYLRSKKYARAIQEFQAVLARNPDDADVRKALALAFAMAGRRDEAIVEFERYAVQRPEDPEAYVFLANLYKDRGDQEKAIQALERLIASTPKGHRLAEEARGEIERLRAGGGKRSVTFEELLEGLDSEDVETRRETMRMLVSLEIYPPPGRMLKAVRDEDVLVRVLAVRNLGRVGSNIFVAVLEMLLRHERDRDASPEVRGACVQALRTIRTPCITPVLLAALDDESLYVFRIAVEGLRKISGQAFAAEPDEPLTEEDREEVRRGWRAWWRGPRSFARKLETVADILKVGEPRLVRFYLVPLLEDEESAVAERVWEAFGLLTGTSPGPRGNLKTAEGRAMMRAAAEMILLEQRESEGK